MPGWYGTRHAGALREVGRVKSPGGTLLQLAGPDWGAVKGRGARRKKKVMTARRGLAGDGDTRLLETCRTGEGKGGCGRVCRRG